MAGRKATDGTKGRGPAREGRRMWVARTDPDGDPDEAALWDARSEIDIALLITRYLAESRPPADAVLTSQWEEWASHLLHDGRDRLAVLGRPPLRAV